MKLQATAVLAFAALVSGCAAPPKYEWVKADATPATREANFSECQYQVKLNKIPSTEQAELISLCMRGKGYRFVQIN